MVFVFLQVGNDLNTNLMVKSINLTNPNARIIQCSDVNTNKIEGVSEIFRLSSDTKNLMIFRLEIFSKLKLVDTAIYLDADMLVLEKINILHLLQDCELALCKRSFGLDDLINISFGGLDLKEYSNMKLSDVYPILACFTISKSYDFWESCLENLIKLDPKFHAWYGDQEAIRNVIKDKDYKINFLYESQVACLPEFYQKDSPPLCLHFKGRQRKLLMSTYYSMLSK